MNKLEGIILIDKPLKITSHQVVEKLRKITGIKKIGHSGTLDPLATGLLILGIGRKATRNLSNFLKLDKEYIAKIRLGAVSNTLDKEGKIEMKEVKKIPKRKKVEKILKFFSGKIKQTPPIFSAKKIKGTPLYKLIRKGIKIQPRSVEIEIYKIKILKYQWPYLKIKVHCSSGTYIRSLANDIGEKLNCGGYLEELKRTKIGKYSVRKAIKLSKLNSRNWKNFLIPC